MNYEEYLFFLFSIFFGIYLMGRGFSSETLSLTCAIFGLFIFFFAFMNLLFLGPGSKVATMPADIFFAVVAGMLIAWAFGKTIERRT
ncbi:MAG: hypothetical protein WC639_01170 [Patescibacteria group bacterium]|jgi:hypothetical protein